MRKMTIIIAIIFLFLSVTNLFLLFGDKRIVSPSFANDPIVKGKRFGDESYPVRFWAQANSEVIQELAKKLKGSDEIETVSNIYNWFEKGYTYTNDEMKLTNGDRTVITAGSDTWMLPTEVIREKEQNNDKGFFDCEDSAVIASLLEASGLKAYMNIGIIKITKLKTGEVSNYGHGWPSVVLAGKEYILESTLGRPLEGLKSGTVFQDAMTKVEYIPYVKFNLKEVIQMIGADINSRPAPLPLGKIDDLKEVWK